MVILRSRRARRPARALVIAAGGLLAAVPAAGQGQAGSESASALAQGLTAGGGAAGDGVRPCQETTGRRAGVCCRNSAPSSVNTIMSMNIDMPARLGR